MVYPSDGTAIRIEYRATVRGGEMADSLRGKAAIVGVADLASPTGELDLHGRALEIADDQGGAR